MTRAAVGEKVGVACYLLLDSARPSNLDVRHLQKDEMTDLSTDEKKALKKAIEVELKS